MKILLSNDDGYQAPGLVVLARALDALDEVTVTVVAPQRNCSGASNSLSLRKQLLVRREPNGFYSVAGTPTDCVHLAINGMLDFQPDMAIAGINHGANLGDDVLYSGTVAAAIEGRFLGLPALAVSLANDRLANEDLAHEGIENFQTAAEVVLRVLENLRVRPLPPDTILNINVPNRPFAQLRGIRATRLGARHQAQPILRQAQAARRAAAGQRAYRIGTIGAGADAGAGTDFHAVQSGAVSVTPMQIDMTRHDSLSDIANWLTNIHLAMPMPAPTRRNAPPDDKQA